MAGGHSSRPRPDNAIYSLSAALVKIGRYEFPVQFSDTTRAYFTENRKAHRRRQRSGDDTSARRRGAISVPTPWYPEIRLSTRCCAPPALPPASMAGMPTMHSHNVPRQTSTAGCSRATRSKNVRAQLVKAADDSSLSITASGDISPTPPPPPLNPLVYGTAKTLAQKHFPGVPMLPAMSTGATDGRYLNASGIPTYGVPGRFSDPDGGGVHGLNERKSVEGLYEERDYLFDLIKAYANSP